MRNSSTTVSVRNGLVSGGKVATRIWVNNAVEAVFFT